MTNKIIIKKLNGDVLGNDIAKLCQLPTGTTSNIFIQEEGFEPQSVVDYVTQTSRGPPPPPPPADSNTATVSITVQDTGSDPCGNNLPISGVTASGNDGNVPQNVLDNNLATRWSSKGIGQFITADLGTAKTVCGVGIAWYRGNERISHFVISTSTNGTTFTNRFSGDSSGTTLNSEKYTFTTPVNARYVRVTVNGNTANTWASITELDVFGPSSNSPPVANNQAVTTNKNTAIGIILTASDADNNPLTYSVVTPPAHGTLSGTAPNLNYNPNTDYVGPDSFTFKANDGTADSNTATVSITVQDTPTGVLWDSNVDSKWNNGTKRTITTKQNGQQPCDKSIFVAASGSPKLVIDGNGIAHLVSGSGGVDNLSLKLRSRHQAGGDPENRAGGEGIAITNSSFSCQRENFHNDHDTIKNGSLPKSFSDNKWVKIKFSCKDESAGKIRLKASIDYLDGQGYKEFMNVVDSGAPDYFFDKNMFKALSWFWVRLNNADFGRIYVCACNYDAQLEGEYMFEDSKNSIAMRNIRLTAL